MAYALIKKEQKVSDDPFFVSITKSVDLPPLSASTYFHFLIPSSTCVFLSFCVSQPSPSRSLVFMSYLPPLTLVSSVMIFSILLIPITHLHILNSVNLVLLTYEPRFHTIVSNTSELVTTFNHHCHLRGPYWSHKHDCVQYIRTGDHLQPWLSLERPVLVT